MCKLCIHVVLYIMPYAIFETRVREYEKHTSTKNMHALINHSSALRQPSATTKGMGPTPHSKLAQTSITHKQVNTLTLFVL